MPVRFLPFSEMAITNRGASRVATSAARLRRLALALTASGALCSSFGCAAFTAGKGAVDTANASAQSTKVTADSVKDRKSTRLNSSH